jgi:hypothetical protein
MSGLGYIARHPAVAYGSVAASQVIFQLTAAAGDPLTIKKIKLQSSAVTSGQAIYGLQWGFYVTGHAAGTSLTPLANNQRNGTATSAAFRYASATLGTTFTIIEEFQWNIALPFEETEGLPVSEIEVKGAGVWAMLLTTQSITPTLSGSVLYEER